MSVFLISVISNLPKWLDRRTRYCYCTSFRCTLLVRSSIARISSVEIRIVLLSRRSGHAARTIRRSGTELEPGSRSHRSNATIDRTLTHVSCGHLSISFERSMRRPGIEPGLLAWEANVLPLDQRRSLYSRPADREPLVRSPTAHSLYSDVVPRSHLNVALVDTNRRLPSSIAGVSDRLSSSPPAWGLCLRPPYSGA